MLYSTLHRLNFIHTVGKYFLTDRFFLFRWIYYLLGKVSFKRKVKRNGASFTVLLKNGIGILNFQPDYESWMNELLPKLLTHDKQVFIDVGANTGQTLLKTVPYFPTVEYYAIEPNPTCADYLQSLIDVNSYDSVRIRNHALSNVNEPQELQLRYKDDVLATTSPGFRTFTQYSTTIKVPAKTGDEFVKEEGLDAISIIKMDVEGGEANVLEGFKKSIERFQPLIICEILPLESKDDGVTKFRIEAVTKIFDLLNKLNYKIINIKNNLEVKSIDEISKSLEASNYLFVPEKVLDFISEIR